MNNPDIFDAAYAGCFGGSSGRIFHSTTPIDYDNYILAVKAFALAVDSAVPAGDFSPAADALMMELCHGFWNDRFPQNQDPAFYAALVQPIVTLFFEAGFFLA